MTFFLVLITVLCAANLLVGHRKFQGLKKAQQRQFEGLHALKPAASSDFEPPAEGSVEVIYEGEVARIDPPGCTVLEV